MSCAGRGRLLLAVLTAFSLTSGASAGRLDLDIYAARPQFFGESAPPPSLSLDLWRPGTPLALRGQGPGMRAFSHAGYATLGALGMAETIRGMGRDGYNEASAVGFGLITVINLWRLWKVGKVSPGTKGSQSRF